MPNTKHFVLFFKQFYPPVKLLNMVLGITFSGHFSALVLESLSLENDWPWSEAV